MMEVPVEYRKAVYDELEEAIWEVEVGENSEGWTFTFLLFNDYYESVVGAGHEAMAGKTLEVALKEPSAAITRVRYEECVNRREEYRYTEYIQISDSWCWWSTTLKPKIKDGVVYRILGQAKKVTSMEAQIRDALQVSQFEVYYQPIVRLADGYKLGYEALIRWPDTTFSPADFMPVAKAAGLLRPLTQLVISKAARAVVRITEARSCLSEERPPWIAINVSSCDFESHLSQVVNVWNLKPGQIRFEVTEDTDLSPDVVSCFRRIALMGYHFELDDFGTESANFCWLSELPFKALKLDASFVKGAYESHNQAVVCKAAVQIARNHNPPIDVIAEGVETRADQEFVESVLKLRYGQGYFLGKPAPLEYWIEQEKNARPGIDGLPL